jgi:hypothetical protein
MVTGEVAAPHFRGAQHSPAPAMGAVGQVTFRVVLGQGTNADPTKGDAITVILQRDVS